MPLNSPLPTASGAKFTHHQQVAAVEQANLQPANRISSAQNLCLLRLHARTCSLGANTGRRWRQRANLLGTGRGFGFADGHAEIHKWLDPRTMPPMGILQLSEIISSPNNVDVAWLQLRGSVSTASQ